MKFTRFEEIIAWQKSKKLSLLIYKEFKNCRDYGFKDQIQRATISIMNNIAEGYERNSNKEFRNFLFISKGSSGEVRSMLYISKDLNYISNPVFIDLNNRVFEISKIISGLIKSLRI
ncbi:S23 ribosomal protein (fragment) [Candidatus Roizmanbacteria bacterium]